MRWVSARAVREDQHRLLTNYKIEYRVCEAEYDLLIGMTK